MGPSRNRVNILCLKRRRRRGKKSTKAYTRRSENRSTKTILISNIHSIYLYILCCVVIDKVWNQTSLSATVLFPLSPTFPLSRRLCSRALIDFENFLETGSLSSRRFRWWKTSLFSWLEGLWRVWSDDEVKSLASTRNITARSQAAARKNQFFATFRLIGSIADSTVTMNMRQQRITTSQQEVYLIYLMEHTEFAASKIKDGDCCCSALFFLFSFSSFRSHFCENYVLEMCCRFTFWLVFFASFFSFLVSSSCLRAHRWIKVRWKLERAHEDVEQHFGPEEVRRRVENGKLDC